MARTNRPSGAANRTMTGRIVACAAAVAQAFVLTACAPMPTTPGLTDLISRPAERSLMLGLRAYDEGQYPDAERHLQAALRGNLLSVRDQSAAYKHLAFIYCATDRVEPCEQAFLSARRVDAAFALSRSEAGHPAWGPVYRRVLP